MQGNNNSNSKTVYFVGSGPGDPELITLKAKKLVEQADVIIYSGSLFNPKNLKYARKDAVLHDAALIDREKIYQILRDSALEGKLAVRFHDGDPALFSTIREQIDKLEADGITCKVVPGVTAILGAAADLKLEVTLPGITQTLIITRAELRTPVPEREAISELAKHGATMAFYLSVHLIGDVVKELLKGGVYTEQTPAAVVYRATWEDEKIIKGTLGDIAEKTKKEKIIKTALIIVGDVIAPKKYEHSKVYDAGFTHGYRKAENKNSNNK
ncbi:precorrin-4 C(11)-methyltransferase [Nitrososphaera viennensis]|uniref:Precorrin-4 C11-methyltransferase n=2 Tax=Nitrososphaera viennensis TaxID=1034015 RepID=A0A060HSI0_9ARCH|nr:precorrin-4 C(11)-methyltransferase [Nitrososphaera viennensis]AIC16127.1 precorrin-4 C11-methyltransferase [Nitrososphaera viennensis EN76]UVS68090.1 precorrin-4 C(11)-methyltransferase [Nitrososphaera viennensis]